MPPSACKSVKSPALFTVTDNLPFSCAVPETWALSTLVELTVQLMLAFAPKERLPVMVRVPVGASVPPLMVTVPEPELTLTVPLPVNVPEVFTPTLVALTVPLSLTVNVQPQGWCLCSRRHQFHPRWLHYYLSW